MLLFWMRKYLDVNFFGSAHFVEPYGGICNIKFYFNIYVHMIYK